MAVASALGTPSSFLAWTSRISLVSDPQGGLSTGTRLRVKQRRKRDFPARIDAVLMVAPLPVPSVAAGMTRPRLLVQSGILSMEAHASAFHVRADFKFFDQ